MVLSMKALVQFYQFIQNISLDVVFGAMSMTFLFAKLCQVDLPAIVYIILALCVWLIYTFDHLLDAKNIEGLAKTRRHRFHQLHYDTLIIIWLILLGVGALTAIFLLPKVVWYWGGFVVTFSIVHLVLVHYLGSNKSKLVLKEVGVAWIYSAGIVIAPFALAERLEVVYLYSFLVLFLVVLFNLIMFSYFDYERDVRNKLSSIAINWGINTTRYILYTLFAVLSLVSSFALFLVDVNNMYYYFTISFLLSVGIFYLLMVVLIENESSSETYRKIGDAVFLLPFLLLLL